MIIAGINGWSPVADKRGNALDPFLYCDKAGQWWIAPESPNFNPNPK